MTRITDIKGRIRMNSTHPSDPVVGDEYYNTTFNIWFRWTGNNWAGVTFSSTSSSTSTTTSTSTSTTTTTTSTSTTTTTSTSTSTTTTG